MRVKLGIALACLEKTAAIMSIVVPALRGVVSVLDATKVESK